MSTISMPINNVNTQYAHKHVNYQYAHKQGQLSVCP